MRFQALTGWLKQKPPTQPEPPLIKQTPVRPPNMHSDVLVPLVGALVTGLAFGGLAALALMLFFGFSLAALGVAVLFFFGLAWVSQTGVVRDSLYALEYLAGDLNGDGQIGPPKPTPGLVIRGVGDNSELQGQDDLYAELEAFVRACYNDGHTAEAYRVEKDGRDRNRYTYLRDLLILGGYADWISRSRPNVGWRFVREKFPTADSVLAGCRGLVQRAQDNKEAYESYLENGGPSAFR